MAHAIAFGKNIDDMTQEECDEALKKRGLWIMNLGLEGERRLLKASEKEPINFKSMDTFMHHQWCVVGDVPQVNKPTPAEVARQELLNRLSQLRDASQKMSTVYHVNPVSENNSTSDSESDEELWDEVRKLDRRVTKLEGNRAKKPIENVAQTRHRTSFSRRQQLKNPTQDDASLLPARIEPQM